MACVCVSDPPPAAAHMSVGCVRPLLHLSWCQTDSRGEPTHGKGRPEPSAEEHMLRASAFQPPPPANHTHHASWLPILPSRRKPWARLLTDSPIYHSVLYFTQTIQQYHHRTTTLKPRKKEREKENTTNKPQQTRKKYHKILQSNC